MNRSFRPNVPVTAEPHHPQVRAAISEMIADWAPTELRNVKVDRRAADWVTVTADAPVGIGGRVVREVYLDDEVIL